MLVVLNARAGKDKRSVEQRRAAIRNAFAGAGLEAEIVAPDDRCAARMLTQKYADGNHDTVVAAGGDGTVSTVAARLIGTDKTLGVLPFGTRNHFAKDLNIPINLANAVRTIAERHVATIDAAEVNGQTFINNSSVGIYSSMVADREAQQQWLARGRVPAAFWAMLHAFRRFPFMSLQITLDHERLSRQTAFLFVGNNRYHLSGLHLGSRARLDAGELGLYFTDHTGRLGILRLAAGALIGRLTRAKDFSAITATEAMIEAHQPRMLVSRDGEIGCLSTPLRYRVLPRALRVLVPRATRLT